MLIKNPITEIVYNYDYNYRGRENIYDYWIKNRVELLDHVLKHRREIKNFSETLSNFELKIRWSSFYGMLYRFHLKKYLISQPSLVSFEQILIKYGRQYYTHSEFIGIISTYVDRTDLFDLRGISLLKYSFRNTIIEDVDFSNGALNSCVFEKVVFKNCRFVGTEFCGSIFRDCVFEETCTLTNNDFSRAYINGEFRGMVISPLIEKPNWWKLLWTQLHIESPYITYTKIESDTFHSNIRS